MEKVAVIGLGNISKRHRANLKRLYPRALILAMSASGRELLSTPQDSDLTVSGLDELIAARPQLVVVASPASMHQMHAQPLLGAGIACLVEKPLCADIEQTHALVNAAQKVTTPVAVGYCLRYMPSAQKMKQLITEGVFGEIYSIHIEVGQYLPDWRPGVDFRNTVSARKDLGGGALLELSHELDYSNWLFGPLTPKHATIRSSKELALEVEDLVDVSLISQTGAHVQIHMDFLQRKPSRFCTVTCNQGKVYWDLLANRIEWTNNTGHTQVFEFPDWKPNDMYLAMLKDMEQRVFGRQNQCVSLAQANEVMELIDSIKKMQS
ncbi:Gfo/Idh/MocA family protein [Pseudoalteromonas pernae]|uniref:Gfo/Idh/MocA family protein n=1 Tax=Pseudoalteromonas pernae TaxID=3118054 RepID=UPI00324238D8